MIVGQAHPAGLTADLRSAGLATRLGTLPLLGQILTILLFVTRSLARAPRLVRDLALPTDSGAGADWIAHIAHTLVESARVNITLGNVRDSRDMGVSALTRQARSEPVGPPGLIAVDVSEPERGEPRRGPCARVALVVMAVGNDGTARAEPLCGRSIQVLQRDVDRTGKVFRVVFPRSEDINQLSALVDELLDGVTVDPNSSGMRESRDDLRPRSHPSALPGPS